MINSHLPSLTALRAFVEVAHCESFTQATKTLHLTQSAISRQIQQLEEHYGMTLFMRNTRKVELTSDGQRLLPLVEELFHKIDDIEQRMKGSSKFRLQTYLTVITRWLLPHLHDFYQHYSHIQLNLEPIMTDDMPGNFNYADAFIAYGKPDNNNWQADFLFEERAAPVCSPQLSIKTITDLHQHTLLHSIADGSEWLSWLQLQGINSLDGYSQQFFAAYDFAIDAATRGLGITIVDLHLVEEELNSGKLVQPFSETIPNPGAYYLVYPADNAHTNIDSVRSWLLSIHDTQT